MARQPPAKSLIKKDFPTEYGGEGARLRHAAIFGAQQLQQSGNISPARDAELLLLHATGLSRTDLIVRPEQLLTREQGQKYNEFLARRAAHEPVHYILGQREFYGLNFLVTPDVLIPRPETEHLVEEALKRIPADQSCSVADVGTGSGAIAVTLAVHRPKAQVTALDISPEALAVAERNAATHSISNRIRFLPSDLLEAVWNERFDMIVSNPPYIADGDRESLEAQVRDHEPEKALFAGPTGLEVYEKLIPQAGHALRPGGWLLMELGAGQQSALRQLLRAWSEVAFIDDLQAIPRIAVARRSLHANGDS